MKIEDVAKVCHNVNKAFCESLGDMSQAEWDDTSEWQRASAIDGVKYHFVHLNALPSDSHENWLLFKMNEGWVFGTVKDPILKTHPCIVPYLDLPVEQRAKDYIFREICHQLKEYVNV